MNYAKDDTQVLAESLYREQFKPNLGKIYLLLHQDKTPDLIDALLEAAAQRTGGFEGAVDNVLCVLQLLSKVDRVAACTLMAQLWIHLIDIHLGDVADAIDQWISQSKSRVLKEELVWLARGETRPKVKKQLALWIARVGQAP